MVEKRSEFRKTLKGPDAFQSRIYAIGDWFAKKQKLLLAIFTPVVLISVGVGFYLLNQSNQREKRVEALGQIALSHAELDSSLDKQRQALLADIDRVRLELATAREGKQDAKVAELAAREKAMQEEIDNLEIDNAVIIEKYEQFFADHQRHPEGWSAAFTSVAILISEKELEKARDVLEKLIKVSTASSFYQIQGRLTVVEVLEDLQDFGAALTHVEDLLKIASDELKPQVLLTKGRVLMLDQKYEQARAVFDELENQYSERPETQQARGLRTLMRG